MTARRALVTGASRGIGAAVALALAEAGHTVVAASRDRAGLQAVAEQAAAGPGSVLPVPADMDDLAAAAALPGAAAEAAGGPIEIFVHCAGIARPAPVVGIDLADWDTVLRVNLTSAMVISQQVLPPMAAAGWGRVVVIGSLYSRTGGKFSGAYAVSKHGLLGLARVIATEFAAKGVTANAVIPGWTDTEMVAGEARNVAEARGVSADAAVKLFLRGQPIGRLIEPAEIGAMVAFLAGEQAGAITGQAFNVDGGSLQS
ncbi:SDR family oxidoreductase [Nakamurella sp. YIM 132087]|uniref:SDR family oxidoreductase n=1 Tax=Nakamurella alba TaxID=2665158 RepID=A0A7K1FPG8_9ACTN|nr:SDR family oxidoreductase [Nakamurella alba]MTD15980.1 SDR family oxidoreductase [Nakamurella alba]